MLQHEMSWKHGLPLSYWAIIRHLAAAVRMRANVNIWQEELLVFITCTENPAAQNTARSNVRMQEVQKLTGYG